MDHQPTFVRPGILTVSELVLQIRDRLETRFSDVFVEGEIVGFSRPGSGHYYFTMKDDNAQIQAVMFRMQNRLIRFQPQDGMVVVARGRVSCYPPRGQLQMIVDYMEPKGAGALAAAFEQRKRELAEKGYFDSERKKPLPPLPFTIGIVTSPTGAALYDALRIAFFRHPNLHVILSPTLVQGEGASLQITQAIHHLVQDGRSEVILLIRGGGSTEDLWAFNELAVADAIYQCPIPIVTGIGHEIDFTISDFCADLRAPTPTGAAETAVARIADVRANTQTQERFLINHFIRHLDRRREKMKTLSHRLQVRGLPTLLPGQRIDELSGRLRRAMDRGLRAANHLFERSRERLSYASPARIKTAHLVFHSLRQRLKSLSPSHLQHLRRQRLDQLSVRLVHSGTSTIHLHRSNLHRMKSMLNALGPLNVLERGYSITRLTASNSIVTNAEQVNKGDSLDLILHRGELRVEVQRTKKPT